MLELKSVSKSYHDGEADLMVLQDIDLSLRAGESVALLGASGCGKSTLLQIAAGLESPDRGEVLLDGQNIALLADSELAKLRRQALGFVFQDFNLLPGLKVRDNLLFQRRLCGLPDKDPWVDDVIAVLDLGAMLHRPVELLSGGQQQRVAIARALAHRPDWVFADEPTGNLHDTLSQQVIGLLLRLVREAGAGLLLVTHNRALAVNAQRSLRLESGHLQPSGADPLVDPLVPG